MTMRPASWWPSWWWWATLALLLPVGMFGNWFLAAGLLVILLVQVARPLDFLPSFLLVVTGASFVRYEAGQLTLELSLLTVVILFMLGCYALSRRGDAFGFPKTGLLLPLLLYFTLSLANCVRGLMVDNPPKYVMIELLPVLALASSFLVANGFDRRRDLRLATMSLLVMAYANASLGYYVFSVVHARTAGVFFTPVPGIIAMLPLNHALRSRNPTTAFAWTLASLVLFLHQFLSFTRGYWLGCMAGILASLLIYLIGRRASGARWRRAGQVMGTLVGSGVAGALALALISGQSDFLGLAGSRFGSITGTKFSRDTASNVTRLAEYADAIDHASRAPWLGHGLGYTFLTREPIGFTVMEQWFVHQNYLLVWLKQGLLGLALFVWMLWAAARLGWRGARHHEDPWESSWCAAAAAATIFLMTLSLSNFHLDEVNPTFSLALLWGGTMALENRGTLRLRWNAPVAFRGLESSSAKGGP